MSPETSTDALFDIFSFNRLLQTGWLARRFWYFKTIDSTNRFLHDLPGERLTHGLVCLADSQTRGKGQFGRAWYASPGDNLTFSLVLKPVRNTGLQLISLTVMLALKKTLSSLFSFDCHIKWPNDLIVNDKKLSGVLTECRYNGKELDRMLIGLGVNVNQKQFPTYLEARASSLFHVTGGQIVDRSLLLAELMNRLELLLDQAENGDRELIRNISRSIQGYGQWVLLRIDGQKEETPAKILGINEFGYLMVFTADDEVKTFTHEQIRVGVSLS